MRVDRMTRGRMLGWGVCVLCSTILAGCERPSVSTSELGRVDYALPDNPELTKPYQLKDLPEEIDLYNHEVKDRDFRKQLQAHGIIPSDSTTTAVSEKTAIADGVTDAEQTAKSVAEKNANAVVNADSAVSDSAAAPATAEPAAKSDVAEANVVPVASENAPTLDPNSQVSTTPIAPAGETPPPTDSSDADSSESAPSGESTPPSQGFEILEDTESGDSTTPAVTESTATEDGSAR